MKVAIEENVRAWKLVGYSECSTSRVWDLSPGEVLWFQTANGEKFVVRFDDGLIKQQLYAEFLREVAESDLLTRSKFRYWAAKRGADLFLEACRVKPDEIDLCAKYARALQANGWVGLECDANCQPGKFAYWATSLEAAWTSNAEGLRFCWVGLDDELDRLLDQIVEQSIKNETMGHTPECLAETRVLHEMASAIIRRCYNIVSNMSGVFDAPQFADISWRPWHYEPDRVGIPLSKLLGWK